MKDGGWYFIEDVDTSYWKPSESVYGYMLKEEMSIVEHFKAIPKLFFSIKVSNYPAMGSSAEADILPKLQNPSFFK